jgi:hypothetical protein
MGRRVSEPEWIHDFYAGATMLRIRTVVWGWALLACGGDAAPPPPEGSFRVDTVQLSGTGRAPAAVSRARVTSAFFPATGAQPLLGRGFVAEDHSGGAAVALLSEDIWREGFGAAPDIIGQSIDIGGAQVIVVGILPAGFDEPPGAQVWMPLR